MWATYIVSFNSKKVCTTPIQNVSPPISGILTRVYIKPLPFGLSIDTTASMHIYVALQWILTPPPPCPHLHFRLAVLLFGWHGPTADGAI
mmetsp:Transcript_133899/g.232375  ORF Transcript_133899/g.232375 Transcript_133899/m.232375 type:complete len:90 (+) Transcript_133899:620-889(+)